MPQYTVWCLSPPGEDRTYVAVAYDGYPEWIVEAVVANSSAGPIVSNLHVYPRQDAGDGPATIGKRRYLLAMYDALPIEESVRVNIPDPLVPLDCADRNAAVEVPAQLYRLISNVKFVKLAQDFARVREVQTEDIAAAITAAEAMSLVARQVGPLWRRSAEHTRSLIRPVTRTGRKGNGVAHYLGWAKQCHELTVAGNTQVVKTLFHRHGDGATGISRNYIRDTLHEARRLGLLTSCGQGKSGGLLTTLGAERLKEIDDASV